MTNCQPTNLGLSLSWNETRTHTQSMTGSGGHPAAERAVWENTRRRSLRFILFSIFFYFFGFESQTPRAVRWRPPNDLQSCSGAAPLQNRMTGGSAQRTSRRASCGTTIESHSLWNTLDLGGLECTSMVLYFRSNLLVWMLNLAGKIW